MHPAPPSPSRAWAYFLDVDGTLIDIAKAPDAVHVDSGLLDLIGRLYGVTGGTVALISGRGISDLRQYLGELRIPLAGLHGLEQADATGRLIVHAPLLSAKPALKAALAPVLARHGGLMLEDKGPTLALHYRQAPHLASYARRLMARLAGPGTEVQYGKCVAEIKPAGVNKGTALARYMTQPPFKGRRPVFIGDDLNDEHGFAKVNGSDGISIKVGKGESCARYRLANVAAVRSWLRQALPD